MSLHPEHHVAPDATPLGLERAALVLCMPNGSRPTRAKITPKRGQSEKEVLAPALAARSSGSGGAGAESTNGRTV